MDLPRILTVKPDYVGMKILEAYKMKKDVIYVPSIWKLIIATFVLIPERIFKRLNL